MSSSPSFVELAKAVINTEADAVREMLEHIDDAFVRSCNLILNTQGRLVVIGMGKSGHIGNKIAATMASTGTPAFFCSSWRSQSW
jgi:arabinose-5-phosphate isomerase